MTYERYQLGDGELDVINGVVVAATLGLGKLIGVPVDEIEDAEPREGSR